MRGKKETREKCCHRDASASKKASINCRGTFILTATSFTATLQSFPNTKAVSPSPPSPLPLSPPQPLYFSSAPPSLLLNTFFFIIDRKKWRKFPPTQNYLKGFIKSFPPILSYILTILPPPNLLRQLPPPPFPPPFILVSPYVTVITPDWYILIIYPSMPPVYK